MGIRYFLLLNRQGRTRLSKYYSYIPLEERVQLEADLVRQCWMRNEDQCCFFDYHDHKIIYRRYASLFFVVGVDKSENELGILEFIHAVVETLDIYFENVTEQDIMFNIEKAHFIVDEMISNGKILETNKKNILLPLQLIDEIELGL